MKIYESPYQTVYFDEEFKLMRFIWTEETASLRTENYKKEIENQVELMEKYHPERLYADTLYFQFSIVPEIQEWNADLLFPKIVDLGARCWAILVSQDIFSQVSIEQTMEEKDTGQFATRYFDNEEDAINWAKKI